MAEGAKAPVYVEGLPHSGGKRVEIRKSAYRGNGKTALYGVMVDEGGEEDFAVFSVNLPAEASKLGAGQTYMKNWSENAGMLEVLQKAGVVGPTLFEVQTGFCSLTSCILKGRSMFDRTALKAQAVQVLI